MLVSSVHDQNMQLWAQVALSPITNPGVDQAPFQRLGFPIYSTLLFILYTRAFFLPQFVPLPGFTGPSCSSVLYPGSLHFIFTFSLPEKAEIRPFVGFLTQNDFYYARVSVFYFDSAFFLGAPFELAKAEFLKKKSEVDFLKRTTFTRSGIYRFVLRLYKNHTNLPSSQHATEHAPSPASQTGAARTAF